MLYDKLDSFLGSPNSLTLEQLTDRIEEFGLETCNKYQILDNDGEKWGFIAEKSGGILGTLLRLCLRNRRPMNIVVWDKNKQEVLHIKRPFYLFWSNMTVSHTGQKLGNIHRGFSLLHARYHIRHQRTGKILGEIHSKHLSCKFSVRNPKGREIGAINKQLGNITKELLTDADNFFIDFPSDWSSENRALLLAAAITIDMDFFEKSSTSKRF